MSPDILLLSQEETHPFYAGVNAYFTAPLFEGEPLPLEKFSAAPPLGITLLAAGLNRRGWAAKPLYNFFSRKDEALRLAAALERRPFAACISTTHTFRPEITAAIADLVRRLSPGTALIVGGPGAEWNPALRPPDAYTALGPGEENLPALLAALKEGRDPAAVPGIIPPGGTAPASPPAPSADMDALPFPDWGLYPTAPSGVAVQGSRGCPRACGFCSYSAPYAARSAGAVLAEIRHNRERWGISRFRFTDSDFAGDPARALELCRGLEADGGSSWTCFARADSLLRPGLPEALSRAGCQWVFIGVESGSDALLAAMNKGCGREEMLAGITAAKKAGLGLHGNFVVGYPGETVNTAAQTLAFVRNSGLDTVYFSPFQIRSPGIPALTGAQGGLSGSASGWEHSTMSSAAALARAMEMTEEISADESAPLIASQALFSLLSGGNGADYRENVLDFHRALRSWHAARRAGSAAGMAGARERLRRHLQASEGGPGPSQEAAL
jgi:anaerobic magnesium-protoporphyrin IX monomethyl ester cyclase